MFVFFFSVSVIYLYFFQLNHLLLRFYFSAYYLTYFAIAQPVFCIANNYLSRIIYLTLSFTISSLSCLFCLPHFLSCCVDASNLVIVWSILLTVRVGKISISYQKACTSLCGLYLAYCSYWYGEPVSDVCFFFVWFSYVR